MRPRRPVRYLSRPAWESRLVLFLAPVNPGEGVSRRHDALAVVFVLFSTVPLLWRRQAPLTVAALLVCVSLVGSVRGYAVALTTVGALVGLASAAYLTDRRQTVALGAFTLVALITISSIAGGSLLKLRHQAVGMIDPKHREGFGDGWGKILTSIKQGAER